VPAHSRPQRLRVPRGGAQNIRACAIKRLMIDRRGLHLKARAALL
jgi:hypothetical protein